MQMQVRMERICPWIEVVFPFPKDYSIIAIKVLRYSFSVCHIKALLTHTCGLV